ncbi:MAG: hypothetical protein GY769_07700 [bacterium]|nr:hypothetical protein [bacterium]
MMQKTPNIDPDAFELIYKDCRLGERCLIVADGPSCPPEEVLLRADCAIIGTNRTYRRITSAPLDFYVMVDPGLTREIGPRLDEVVSAGLMLTAFPCKGAMTPTTHIWKRVRAEGYHFEPDLARKGWVLCCVVACAIQAAHYLGFRELVFAGFDLRLDRGLHWYEGGKTSQPYMDWQQRWLREAWPTMEKLGLRLINTNPETGDPVSRKTTFDEVFPCKS